MTFKEYQEAAERTARKVPAAERFTNFGMGLAGETGEVIDYLKKVCFHEHPLDTTKLAEELGDVLWYVATLATTAGLDLDQIAEQNIAKLRARYPNGFDVERSRNRLRW